MDPESCGSGGSGSLSESVTFFLTGTGLWPGPGPLWRRTATSVSWGTTRVWQSGPRPTSTWSLFLRSSTIWDLAAFSRNTWTLLPTFSYQNYFRREPNRPCVTYRVLWIRYFFRQNESVMIFPDADSVCLQYCCKPNLGTDRYDLKARIRSKLSRIHLYPIWFSKNVRVSIFNFHHINKYYHRKHSLPNGYIYHCLKSFSAISVFFMYQYFFDLSAASASNVCETNVHYLRYGICWLMAPWQMPQRF